MFVKVLRAGDSEPESCEFSTICEGDTFYVKGVAHVADCDAHYSGDATFDGYLVYDTEGESWFPEDLDRMD